MTDETRDKEFIEYVVKMLVDNPESVKVDRKVDEMGVLITLDVHADDMGMVIGREGMTAHFLLLLLSALYVNFVKNVKLHMSQMRKSLV
jgi:predicted RNA-binding protein YlqC (UPF0109 family)